MTKHKWAYSTRRPSSRSCLTQTSSRSAARSSSTAGEHRCFFFFCQAEDGIRDLYVTGVQTCALPISHKLAAHVLDQFDSLVGVGGLAAVRACAVASVDGQGEDGDGDPFAGLSDSFLYVGRADLLHRVAACWASAYTERAALYRQRRGLDPLSATIGVGVQRMVRAARSFVAFTRDPVDGSDRCVIAAAHGVGEGVVQEKADLDHFYVDLARGTVDGRVVRKARMVGHDPA